MHRHFVVQSWQRRHWLLLISSMIVGLLVAVPLNSHAQQQQVPPAFGEFQIVWVVIGEAAGVTEEGPSHAGRQLFMASDLVSKSLANVKVEQVEVQPVISTVTVGQRLCLTSLEMRAVGPEKKLVAGAPLSISIRQDHKQKLGLNRTKKDICVQPNAAGEYPVRLTSMLPARDGTMRGAQIFIRVSESKERNSKEISASDNP